MPAPGRSLPPAPDQQAVGTARTGTVPPRFLDGYFRILLDVLPTTRAFPEVAIFTYVNSKSSYLIQAADLLSNLTLNAIHHKMGVTNEKTAMKYDMLCSVLSDDPIVGDLLAEFTVKDGKVSCHNPEMLSAIELG